MALGAKTSEDGDGENITLESFLIENGDGPVYGSYASPILNAEGNVVGLVRFKMANSSICLSVSASELRKYEYEICGIKSRVLFSG